MIRIHAIIGGTTYYFGTEPLDYDGKYYEPRITNSFNISTYFSYSDKTGNRIRSLQIMLDNRDGYFNSIETADGLLNSVFALYYGDGSDKSMTFTGNVNSVNEFGDEISLTLMEKGYEYLDTPFPDAQIAYDYYGEEGINENWNAIPICFGTVQKLPVTWIDLIHNRFMVCSGPIYKINKVYFGDTVMYEDGVSNGYKATPESKNIKVRIYKGEGSSSAHETVDTIVSSYAGFCYIEFYDEATNLYIEPRMADNSVPKIYVDLEGIQNSGNTGAERNPAQILHNIYSKNTTQWEGYGLGIDPDTDLDFSDAITECNTQGFLLDGAIQQRDTVGNWIDNILQTCRGAVTEQNGKITLHIDSSKTVSSVVFDEAGETGYDCVVFAWKEPRLEAQINRLKLSYRYNYKTGRYDRKPDIDEESPLGDTHLINSTHATRINNWNVSELQLNLVYDDVTAHKLAQYYFKKNLLQLKTLQIVSPVEVPDNLTSGDVIKLTSSKNGWTEKEFTITELSKGEDNFKLTLQEYDSDVYVYDSITAGSVDEPADASIYAIPDKPTDMALTVGTEILNDGTNQTTINVTFTKPINNVLQTALYFKLSTDSDFKFLTTTLDNKIDYKWTGQEAGDYHFRLTSISATGNYSSLDIDSGDTHYNGQPTAEIAETIIGDESPPNTACIDDVNPILGGASLSICINGGLPSDFDHFIIQRSIKGGGFVTIEDNWTTKLFSDIDKTAIGFDASTKHYNTVQYQVKAVDKSGNIADNWSNVSGSITPLSVESDDLTCNQIIAKDFRTAIDVGPSQAGVLFNSTGMQGWSATERTFFLDSTTGDVCMTGTITATAGNIGGFTIDETEGLYAGSGSTRVQMKSGAGFWTGATAQVDAPFSVNQYGDITAKSGNISGFTIASTGICKNTGSGMMCMISMCSDVMNFCVLDRALGNTAIMGNIASGRFGFQAVDGTLGNVFEVSNICKHIAGWNFNGNCIYSNNITIDSAGSIGTTDFATGNKGWCISCTGDAEFNNITARGAIRTAVFIKDEISVVGGYTLIRPASVLTQDDIAINGGNYLYVDDESQFAINDIIRIKEVGVDYWGYVSDCIVGRITTQWRFGNCNSEVFTKGQAVVNYGSSGSGGILMDGQTPYIDIYTHSGTPWAGLDIKVRLGNLNGEFGFSTDTYGIAIGCTTGHYLTYDTASDTLNMTGAINIQSGSSGIGNLNDAGNLATADNLDDVTDGSCYFKSTANQNTGGALGYNTLTSANGLYGVGRADTRSVDSPPVDYPKGKVEEFKFSTTLGISGGDTYGNLTTNKPWTDSSGGYAVQTYEDRYGLWERRAGAGESSWETWHKITDNTGTLVNRVIPTVNASPSGDGLYMGSDYMGFYQASTWKTYMDNSGNFYLSGSSGNQGLSWDAGNNCLTIDGDITACSGNIGGWTISSTKIVNNYFTLDSTDGICANYTAGSLGFCIGQAGNAEFNNIIVRGCVEADSGYIGCYSIISGMLVGCVPAYNSIAMKVESGTYTNCITPYNLYICDNGNTTGYCRQLSICILSGMNINQQDCNGANLTGIQSSYANGSITLSQRYNYNSRCGKFYLNSALNGNTAGTAIMSICVYGGDDCFAMCTNGQIQNSYNYSTVCIYTPIICATSCVKGYCINATCDAMFCGAGGMSMCWRGASVGNGGNTSSPFHIYSSNSAYAAMNICGHSYATGFHSTSDCNLKTDFHNYDVLSTLRKIDINAWRFCNDTTYHIGMTSQDFYNNFNCFAKGCTTVPMMDGIALKGVKEVDENLQQLENTVITLKDCTNMLESRNKFLETKFFELEDKLNNYIGAN